MVTDPKNLSDKTLGTLAADNPEIRIPHYDRSQVQSGIVHIGPGNFFRGHLAVYMDDVLNSGDMRWGITAVELRSGRVRDLIEPQDNLYTVFERDGVNHNPRVIGSIKEMLVARDDPQAIIDKMANPQTKIVSMTVTQSGYYYNSDTGQLDFDNEDIKKCLASDGDPTTTVGFIVKALQKRMEAGTPPFSVLSCDNLPGNGSILRNVVLAYAGEVSPELQDWIDQNVAFPNTMVDRIVPRTGQEQVDDCQERLGITDQWPIYTESFRQFVIEDEFCNDIPDFRSVGALVTDDVSPFELLKIRMLNGTHMAMGMIGRMSGHEFSHEAINDPDIRTFIDGFMTEMEGTLPKKERYESHNLDIGQYKADVIQRIANPEMKDELSRLARNGFDKINSRVLMPMRTAIAREEGYDHLAFTTATWIKYLKEAENMDIFDDKAHAKGLPSLAANCGDSPSPLLAIKEIFGTELPSNGEFVDKVTRALEIIEHSDNFRTALTTFNQKGLADQGPSSYHRPDEPKPFGPL